MTAKTDTLLAATAYWTAAVRANESARKDALFRDPWASVLAGSAGAAWMAERTPESVLPIVLRTRYFDDFLAQSRLEQVVLLAAGLDTRAYRLDWLASTCVYEIDQASVLDYKAEILKTAGAELRCSRRGIPADLADNWQEELLEAGFDPQKPSAWLLEGFLFYIPNELIIQVLHSLSSLSAPGSQLGFDIINSTVLTSPYTKAWVELQARAGAAWIGSFDDPESYLDLLGWHAALTQAGQPDAHYGRWTLPVYPTKMAGMPHNWFVTAVKK